MKPVNDYIDIVKAFGKQNYVIYKHDYRDRIKESPIVKGLWTVGRWFSYVANTHTWELEFVAGDSVDVIAYTYKEILSKGPQFVAELIFPEDYPFVNHTIQLAMNYVNELATETRPYVYVIYYNRCVRKDGKVITTQNQSIPLVFDAKNIPFVFANIITDISHIRPTNIPQSIVVNKLANKQFHLNQNNLQLTSHNSQFTQREREIIKLLIQGMSSREISEQLHISYETARTHRKNILKKAEVRNTSQLTHYVLMNNVL